MLVDCREYSIDKFVELISEVIPINHYHSEWCMVQGSSCKR